MKTADTLLSEIATLLAELLKTGHTLHDEPYRDRINSWVTSFIEYEQSQPIAPRCSVTHEWRVFTVHHNVKKLKANSADSAITRFNMTLWNQTHFNFKSSKALLEFNNRRAYRAEHSLTCPCLQEVPA